MKILTACFQVTVGTGFPVASHLRVTLSPSFAVIKASLGRALTDGGSVETKNYSLCKSKWKYTKKQWCIIFGSLLWTNQYTTVSEFVNIVSADLL